MRGRSVLTPLLFLPCARLCSRCGRSLVVKQLSSIDGSRRCWQQIGAVLAEKKVEEVLPVLIMTRDQVRLSCTRFVGETGEGSRFCSRPLLLTLRRMVLLLAHFRYLLLKLVEAVKKLTETIEMREKALAEMESKYGIRAK